MPGFKDLARQLLGNQLLGGSPWDEYGVLRNAQQPPLQIQNSQSLPQLQEQIAEYSAQKLREQIHAARRETEELVKAAEAARREREKKYEEEMLRQAWEKAEALGQEAAAGLFRSRIAAQEESEKSTETREFDSALEKAVRKYLTPDFINNPLGNPSPGNSAARTEPQPDSEVASPNSLGRKIVLED